MRMIRDSESEDYDDVSPSLESCRKDLESVDSEWDVRSDETRGETQAPFIDGGEWVEIRSYDSRKLETWGADG